VRHPVLAATGATTAPGASGRADDPRECEESDVDAGRFRQVLGRFVTGVAVMTTIADGAPHGMTASSVTSVSLHPPLVLVCVDREATMADEVVDGGCLRAVVPRRRPGAAVGHLRRPEPPRRRGAVRRRRAPQVRHRRPILDGAVGWVDARVHAVHEGGDHLIVVGEVVDLGHDPARKPLAYHAGAYADLAERDR
jgi:flavin reductase (DIM6/NTAB) family NADH-FMN oxidoreductase RutF